MNHALNRSHLQPGKYYLTDGGIETTLIFHKGIDLPHFAAFDLLKNEEGRAILDEYYLAYLALAEQFGTGFILESPTWRASSDWGYLMGYNKEDIFRINQIAIDCLKKLRNRQKKDMPVLISGCIGPRSDGYIVGEKMSESEAMKYHSLQTRAFKEAGADLVTAITMNYTEEALGLVAAAKSHDMPAVISFTLETDGRLPGGDMLGDVIQDIDEKTGSYPSYYMINCAHPEHFASSLQGEWTKRIRGLRANASRKSHAELDEADELDTGDKSDLARQYADLFEVLPNLSVLGGCCGTDHTHLESIAQACLLAESNRSPQPELE
jgi:S-methylmethionine-dependent homocysteine/selenocysteine methylase